MNAQQLPEQWRSWWEERAALMEYEAGLSRAEAERAALRCVQEWIRRAQR